MADEIEGTFDKLKAGAKAVAKKVTDPGKDLGDEYEKEKGKGTSKDYLQSDKSGSNDPMSPEKIASHEPTAVKRDPKQGAGGEPVMSNSGNTKQITTGDSGKPNESTPGVAATFSSRQELKDHTQQQH
jgi:hypothetical protein